MAWSDVEPGWTLCAGCCPRPTCTPRRPRKPRSRGTVQRSCSTSGPSPKETSQASILRALPKIQISHQGRICMKSMKAIISAVAFLLTVPVWAQSNTYFGGFEDTTGRSSDYDYNDVVFSISGSGLTLDYGSQGAWYAAVTPNNNGNPFWDNTSSDTPGATNNVGFCMYGAASTCDGHGGQ